ncbi:hypothetical protein L226DRAFT_541157 [Lentinus tigrinus ALCF2SS1-7]|uniref:uncharacterized protein n=1 Tax=Lentinus tigrinus ALCF2SS1-7 TaxID=1328758 RepID=UPI001165F729|nr:hypothetical protein L226DRAFT_541168 [Lentinus tigrinus ALCF2SS1-7]RPD67854.1 hypothetical protein L226DRAFT_541157 [Lentinus tigrinus ALCF2SS1-7]
MFYPSRHLRTQGENLANLRHKVLQRLAVGNGVTSTPTGRSCQYATSTVRYDIPLAQ